MEGRTRPRKRQRARDASTELEQDIDDVLDRLRALPGISTTAASASAGDRFLTLLELADMTGELRNVLVALVPSALWNETLLAFTQSATSTGRGALARSLAREVKL